MPAFPTDAVDPALVFAWAAGWALCRDVPPPARIDGGLRIDTGSAAERARVVLFAADAARIAAVAAAETASPFALKICAAATDVAPHLPPGFALHEPRAFMSRPVETPSPPIPAGPAPTLRRTGAVLRAEIRDAAGAVLAGGRASIAPPFAVFDDVGTAPSHRRLGFGRAIMGALDGAAAAAGAATALLVATGDGRPLYAALGWRVLHPYTSAIRDRRPS